MSFSTHFALSNFEAEAAAADGRSAADDEASFEKALTVVDVALEDASVEAAVGEDEGAGAAPVDFAGAEGRDKKDVIEALTLGFLALLVATSAALRLIGVAIGESG